MRAPLVLVLLMLVLAMGGETVRDALAYERDALARGELWRALSCSLVHLGWYHASLNLLGLLALVILCPQTLSAREWVQRLVVLSLMTSLGLYVFVPELVRYVGFSGVLHGLFFLGLWPQARRGDALAVGCLLYLAGKLIWEILVGAPVSDEIAIGGRVVTQAHLFGTLGALAYAGVVSAFGRDSGKGEITQ
ncbi:MAG: rhombosortase [Panacagrimonas sp.]